MVTEKVYVNWGEIEELVNKLYGNIPYPMKSIVAVSRGGLIPGVMLSHLSGCRNFHTLRCRQYEDKTHQKGPIDVAMTYEANIALLNGDTVLIDDIIDSGSTMQLLDQKYPNAFKCALIRKSESALPHIVCARLVPSSQWIEFPWELSNAA